MIRQGVMRSLKQMMDLSGRKALVSGGSGHIALAVEEVLAELGASIAILDLDAAACQERSKILLQLGAKSAIPIECDLKDEQMTRRAVHWAIKEMDGLDILVHCAAYVGTTHARGWDVPFKEQTVAAWDDALRVNLTSVFVMIQEAKEALSASGHASVILFGSIYGLVGPDHRLYEGVDMANPAGGAASKGGLLQLARYLATSFAPSIRVNVISPGGVWRNQPEMFHKRYVSRVPLGRMAVEEDLKGAVAYLASDLSAYVTGHNLIVDGGWTVW